jgi:electron transfer flavoprotein beta subunit
VNIVVCVKAVPSRANNPAIVEGGQKIRVESPQWLFNESDEYALEEALFLKKNFRGSVTVITVGPIHAQEVLYSSVARGADKAIRVDADEFDPNIVAYLLSRAIKKLSYDVILTGVESSDGMSSQVGISLATELALPYAYAVTKVEAAADLKSLIVERELGGGSYQTLEITLPALFCIQSGIARLTYTPVAKLFQARRSGAQCFTLRDLGLDSEQLKDRRKTTIVEILQREKSNRTQMLTGNPAEIAHFIFEKIKEVG